MTPLVVDRYRWKVRYHRRRLKRTKAYGSLRDLTNAVRYGAGAPRCGERIWVRPTDCVWKLPNNLAGFERSDSGRVEHGDWPYDAAFPVLEDPIVVECLAHWVHGQPWRATGAFDRMRAEVDKRGSSKGARTTEEIERYWDWLDQLHREVVAHRRLRTQVEVDHRALREKGGIIMHVGPDGTLFKGSDGHHRFSMALSAGLTLIPAQLGTIHREALPLLPQLRARTPAGPRRPARAPVTGADEVATP